MCLHMQGWPHRVHTNSFPIQGWKNVYLLVSKSNSPHNFYMFSHTNQAKLPSNCSHFPPNTKLSLQGASNIPNFFSIYVPMIPQSSEIATGVQHLGMWWGEGRERGGGGDTSTQLVERFQQPTNIYVKRILNLGLKVIRGLLNFQWNFFYCMNSVIHQLIWTWYTYFNAKDAELYTWHQNITLLEKDIHTIVHKVCSIRWTRILKLQHSMLVCSESPWLSLATAWWEELLKAKFQTESQSESGSFV